jgi:hypothetical protein
MSHSPFASVFDSSRQIFCELFGLRYGNKGAHSSRTIMLAELRLLLEAVPGDMQRNDYARAVLSDNCLGKRTTATRKLSFQRLSELYGLDPDILLFRALRHLWGIDPNSQPLLALLLALARDPLLRITAASVFRTPFGDEFVRQTMTDDLSEATAGRFNDSILAKIVRNAASSWTQSGHLQGRAKKFRQQAQAAPASCAYALLLAYLMELRGQALFDNCWTKVLDLSPDVVRDLADDARRLGLLDIKQSGSIIAVSFPRLLSSNDRELIHGAHRKIG